MLLAYPRDKSRNFDISSYHNILCPPEDYPSFLKKYISLPLLQRLSGIGLLCGTDWTSLYQNRFCYSRLDHSIGTALIAWHFTHSKAQTIAALLHDVSTTVFSHVSDFRKGDALTQTITESPNATILRSNAALLQLLKEDGLTIQEVEDYHKYPICDNEIPNLSADRLEYMFPSGAALQGSWSLEEIRQVYQKIQVLKNENGQDELGFTDLGAAEIYVEKFLETGHILQLNENKLTLHLLGQITNLAIELGIITEEDCFTLSEAEVIERFQNAAEINNSADTNNSTGFCKSADTNKESDEHQNPCTSIKASGLKQASGPMEEPDSHKNLCTSIKASELNNISNSTDAQSKLKYFSKLFTGFSTMKSILHTQSPVENAFCVNLKVKMRYINPLVQVKCAAEPTASATSKKETSPALHPLNSTHTYRISQISKHANSLIQDFLAWSDTPFGCLELSK